MDPREKETVKKAVNKNHAQNNQDQDSPHQVQETSASTENEYFSANEDEKPPETNAQPAKQSELKKALEMDDDQLEDQKEDTVN